MTTKFTFDTNCLIDVDEDRQQAEYVRQILDAARKGKANVAIAVSAASERQKGKDFLISVKHFRSRIDELGFSHAELLPPLLRIGMGFWNWGRIASEKEAARERMIFSRLFPGSQPEWVDFAAQEGVDPNDRSSAKYYKWRNKILDAQAYWAHEFYERDVFVTSDRNFRRLQEDLSFPRALIQDPQTAATTL